MSHCRELSRKAERANNVWWRVSGLLGDDKRVLMYAVLQAIFTVATLALTVPMFKSYRMHTLFEIFKLTASVWNGGNYFFEVMPRQVEKQKKRKATKLSGNGTTSGETGGATDPNSGDNATDAKRRHLTPTIVKSTSLGYVKSGSGEQLICGLCKRSSSMDVSELASLVQDHEDSVGLLTSETDGVATLRKRAGHSSHVEAPNGIINHFERTVCAS